MPALSLRATLVLTLLFLGALGGASSRPAGAATPATPRRAPGAPSTGARSPGSGALVTRHIPRTWDDEAIRTLEVPLADSAASPRHIASDYYYRMPVRPVFRTYPIYRPDREPAGYLDSLRAREPETLFDAARLRTEADWIRAGELVFSAPIDFVDSGELFDEVRDPAWYAKNRVPVTKEGIFPFMTYVVREKGKVEVGILACAGCHTRVMPDGSIIKGAQGNFPDDRTLGDEYRRRAARPGTSSDTLLAEFRADMYGSYATPWLPHDPHARIDSMSLGTLSAALEAIPPGVCARQGTSLFYPARIPDLIGARDRRYFDSSGHVRHRSIGDLMRYAAINQGADELASYAGWRPHGALPDPTGLSRYSDEQLYALALYVYALKPPRNPNRGSPLAARGRRVFERERCARCHTPPLYTNNTLTPTEDFEVPAWHRKAFHVTDTSLYTDPSLAMQTRRGTGYYKVPSLKGVWYRGPFEHNGSVATLEDWFDPRRHDDDYEPTGFRRFGRPRQAVPGHNYGLELTPGDKRALIAFLKTL